MCIYALGNHFGFKVMHIHTRNFLTLSTFFFLVALRLTKTPSWQKYWFVPSDYNIHHIIHNCIIRIIRMLNCNIRSPVMPLTSLNFKIIQYFALSFVQFSTTKKEGVLHPRQRMKIQILPVRAALTRPQR